MATAAGEPGAATWTGEGVDQMGFMHKDEVILVTPDDEVVGHCSKYDSHRVGHQSFESTPHRAFSVFLFNEADELLLQRRADSKITFPGVWTNTCCSHPLWGQAADETEPEPAENPLGVRRAAVRKLGHELGIAASDAPLDGFRWLGRIHYKAPSDDTWGEHEVDHLLFLKGPAPALAPNPDEVSDSRYVTQEGLRELLRAADEGELTVSPWFRLIAEHMLFPWWEKLAAGTLDAGADGIRGVRPLELGDIDPRTGRRPLR